MNGIIVQVYYYWREGDQAHSLNLRMRSLYLKYDEQVMI